MRVKLRSEVPRRRGCRARSAYGAQTLQRPAIFSRTPRISRSRAPLAVPIDRTGAASHKGKAKELISSFSRASRGRLGRRTTYEPGLGGAPLAARGDARGCPKRSQRAEKPDSRAAQTQEAAQRAALKRSQRAEKLPKTKTEATPYTARDAANATTRKHPKKTPWPTTAASAPPAR